VIDYLGNVLPCTHYRKICGNLFEKDIQQIWKGSAMNKWREKIPQVCFDCSSSNECLGGCRAAAILAGLNSDPLITGPLSSFNSNCNNLSKMLFEGLYPIPQFKSIKEDFGYLLFNEYVSLPVSFSAKNLINDDLGKITLRQIYERHGQNALDLVGQLHHLGLVQLHVESTSQ
jgi:radical SAM protein with 4Fe4S-binding SPASM domain